MLITWMTPFGANTSVLVTWVEPLRYTLPPLTEIFTGQLCLPETPRHAHLYAQLVYSDNGRAYK